MLQITGVNLYLESIKYSVEQVSTGNENVQVSRLLEIVDCTETKISVRLRKELKSINECHFDHIEAYAKGGKSIKTNCQILCSDCNLKKNDKELADFLLDEKAKKFLEGNIIDEDGLNIKKENDSLNNSLNYF